MADKRISQLVDRGTVANNDVVPIVVSGATTTNKATISSIQTFMQGNLDLGVTSVGITLGSSGTDVNVTGSPITTSGNITINIPDASATARGVVNTNAQTFAGAKTFNNSIIAGTDVQLVAAGSANPTILRNTSGTSSSTTGSNVIGFNSTNNIFVTTQSRGGFILGFNNSVSNREYTLPDASGTIALTSNLTGFVTLNTAQTITAQKTFTTSGGTDSVIISHGSGSGIALDVIKAGSGQAIRVQKTSGGGDAVTITGGRLSAEAGLFSGDLQSSTRLITATGAQSIILTANSGGTTNRIEASAGLPLHIVTSGSSLALAAGGTTPQFTLSSAGLVTLTGALNGTSAVFSGGVSATSFNLGNGQFLRLTRTSGGLQYDALGIVAGTDNTRLISTGDFDIVNGALTSYFKVASTGAATFSSNVTAGGFLGFNVGNTNGIIRRTTVNGSNGIRIQGNANDTISDTNAGSSIFVGGGVIGDTFEGSIVLTAYGSVADNNRNQIIFENRSGVNTVTERMRINHLGNVGIGTATPEVKTEVAGTEGIVSLRVTTNNGGVSASNYSEIQLADNTTIRSFWRNMRDGSGSTIFSYNDNLRIQQGATLSMLVNSAGNVGIGTATPIFQLQLSTDSAAKPISALWTIASDARIKENITPYEKGLNELMQINPINYDYNGLGGFTKGKGGVGIIAQEIAGILPDTVNSYPAKLNEDDEEETDVLNFNGHELIYVLINSIKELKTEIDSLKNQIK